MIILYNNETIIFIVEYFIKWKELSTVYIEKNNVRKLSLYSYRVLYKGLAKLYGIQPLPRTHVSITNIIISKVNFYILES